jgi:hypothetical protein
VTINGRTAAQVSAAVARLREEFPAASITGLAEDLGGAVGCAAFAWTGE